MSRVAHVCNIDFEIECDDSMLPPLSSRLFSSIPCFQLQFLPLLFGGKEDLVAVTHFPDEMFLNALNQSPWIEGELPQLILISEVSSLKGAMCEPWGYSPRVRNWADQREIKSVFPDWEIVKRVNSKLFSHKYSPFPQAKVLFDEKELREWIGLIRGGAVLKSYFGFSGRGNRFMAEGNVTRELLSFCQREWSLGRGIVAEPWVKRFFDFSTQWFIDISGAVTYLGATVFETDERGIYRGTIAGSEEIIFSGKQSFLERHKEMAQSALEEVAQLGFFGNIGVDALIFMNERGGEELYPIVEINGRKTLSFVALCLQKRGKSQDVLKMRFAPCHIGEDSLLPLSLDTNDKIVHFRHALNVQQSP